MHNFINSEDLLVTQRVTFLASRWNALPVTTPAWLKPRSAAERAANESDVERRFAAVAANPRGENIPSSFIAALLLTDSGNSDHAQETLDRMAAVARQFIEKASAFDKFLTSTQLLQALRNLWIMNSMQVLDGREILLTPSMVAYSLLYPYTDGRMDDRSCSRTAKLEFGRRLTGRLEGLLLCRLLGKPDGRISKLVAVIEKEWPRHRYPGVYASLLAIHQAQMNSLSLQECRPFDEADVLTLTFAKGGTSVLADGFMLRGDLDEPSRRWAFGYGTFLQLIDDLQDLEEDATASHTTLFTNARRRSTLGSVVNRLLHYLGQMLDEFPHGHGRAGSSLLQLIRQGCLMLVLESLAVNPEFAQSAHGRRMERFSPLRFDYLRVLKKRVADLQTSKSLNMFEQGGMAGGHFIRHRPPAAA